jgi:aspartate aminotransferase/aminotransferase
MTGWRIGIAHGPAEVIDTMTMLQQYSFVCAPQPLQWAALAAIDVDMSDAVASYRERRDRIVAGLTGAGYEIARPGGAFYVFPKVPDGYASDTAFVEAAIDRNLLVIPGNIFSRRDTHFRISYAASFDTIDRGIDVLGEMAGK